MSKQINTSAVSQRYLNGEISQSQTVMCLWGSGLSAEEVLRRIGAANAIKQSAQENIKRLQKRY